MTDPGIAPNAREIFYHETPKPDACKHEFGGWREFDDGRGGEQVCKHCGMGAMAYTLAMDDGSWDLKRS